jgi:hypothetical protein
MDNDRVELDDIETDDDSSGTNATEGAADEPEPESIDEAIGHDTE